MLIHVVIYSKPSHPHNILRGRQSNFKIVLANYDRPDSAGRRNRQNVQ